MRKLLHKIFGHKIYFIRTENVPGFKDTRNVYRCLGCDGEFHSGVLWMIFDVHGERVR